MWELALKHQARRNIFPLRCDSIPILGAFVTSRTAISNGCPEYFGKHTIHDRLADSLFGHFLLKISPCSV